MRMQTSPGQLALPWWLLCLAALAPPGLGADIEVGKIEVGNIEVPVIEVKAVRNGETFDVEASAEFDAGIELAWAVLTDYDRLAEFIPGMHQSRVVSREGHAVVVDQSGEASLLFLTFPIQVRLAIEEQPFDRIESHAISGNFRELSGNYRLEVNGARLTLRYSGRMTPDFAVPPLIGTLLVRNTAARRFRAMVDEILRRQSGRDGAPQEVPAARR